MFFLLESLFSRIKTDWKIWTGHVSFVPERWRKAVQQKTARTLGRNTQMPGSYLEYYWVAYTKLPQLFGPIKSLTAAIPGFCYQALRSNLSNIDQLWHQCPIFMNMKVLAKVWSLVLQHNVWSDCASQRWSNKFSGLSSMTSRSSTSTMTLKVWWQCSTIGKSFVLHHKSIFNMTTKLNLVCTRLPTLKLKPQFVWVHFEKFTSAPALTHPCLVVTSGALWRITRYVDRSPCWIMHVVITPTLTRTSTRVIYGLLEVLPHLSNF